MLHLGTEPKWVSISNKVKYPDDISLRYIDLMEENVKNFETEFATKLVERKFITTNMIIQPRGLTNEKLMCFANSSIQLLFASPNFLSFAYFMKQNRPLFSPRQRELTPAWNALCDFLSNFQFSDSTTSDGATPSLKSLSITKMAFPTNLNVLDKVFGIFSSKRKPLLQEDAIQFLLYFLNLLHEEVLSLMSLAPEDEKASNNGPWKTAGTNRRNIVLQETQGEQSPFTDIFVTMVRSDTLENGRSRTVSKESHLVIPLPIQGHKTLYECIDAFVAEEIITNSISKKTTFLSFPKSIIFGLKRFAYDPFVDRSIKLFDEVEYPEILVLERPMDKVPIKYQLSAIVEHIGKSPEGGHYLCYGRRFDGTWMLFDDDRVVKLADKEYLDKEAYLLLYNQITSFMPDED